MIAAAFLLAPGSNRLLNPPIDLLLYHAEQIFKLGRRVLEESFPVPGTGVYNRQEGSFEAG